MKLPRIAPYPLPQPHEVPSARGPWRLQPERAALLVHDMQRYFLNAYDTTREPVAPAIANLKALLEHSRNLGMPVFYTAQQGNQDRRDRGLQADLWGPGMRAIPDHETIIEDVAPAEHDHVLTKHRYSAFQRTHLADLLRARGRDQLLVTGIYAHIGIVATAFEAFQRDIETFVAADAVADYNRADHDGAVALIADTCGAPLATQTLLETLR